MYRTGLCARLQRGRGSIRTRRLKGDCMGRSIYGLKDKHVQMQGARMRAPPVWTGERGVQSCSLPHLLLWNPEESLETVFFF